MRVVVAIVLLLIGWVAGIATSLVVPPARMASSLFSQNEMPPSPPNNLQIATSAVRAVLRDPFSSYFEGLRLSTLKDGHGPYVCGMVNSKNAMGGYVGLRHFIFALADNTVAFENEDDVKAYRGFTEDWNKICEDPSSATNDTTRPK